MYNFLVMSGQQNNLYKSLCESEKFVGLLEALDKLPFYSKNACFLKELGFKNIFPTDCIPEKPGIYLAYEPTSICCLRKKPFYRVVYIGESNNLKRRIVCKHISGNIGNSTLRENIKEVLSNIKGVLYNINESEISKIIGNYWFRVIIINDEQKRIELEEVLIYLFAKCQICCSDYDLLNRTNRMLWNKQTGKKKNIQLHDRVIREEDIKLLEYYKQNCQNNNILDCLGKAIDDFILTLKIV